MLFQNDEYVLTKDGHLGKIMFGAEDGAEVETITIKPTDYTPVYTGNHYFKYEDLVAVNNHDKIVIVSGMLMLYTESEAALRVKYWMAGELILDLEIILKENKLKRLDEESDSLAKEIEALKCKKDPNRKKLDVLEERYDGIIKSIKNFLPHMMSDNEVLMPVMESVAKVVSDEIYRLERLFRKTLDNKE